MQKIIDNLRNKLENSNRSRNEFEMNKQKNQQEDIYRFSIEKLEKEVKRYEH